MPVVFDAISTSTSSGIGTSFSSTALTVGTGNSRALVVVACFSGTGVTFTDARWDTSGTPQPLTILKQQENATSNTTVIIFGLLNPNSGAKALRLAWDSSRSYAVRSASFTGVGSFENITGNSGTSTTPTVTVPSAVGDFVVAGHTASGAGSITAVNNTSIFIQNDSSALRCGVNRAAGAASTVMTATIGASQPWTSAGVSLKASQKTFYLLNTTGTAPNWGGSLQEGGSPPTAAVSVAGFTVAKVALSIPYFRSRLGATAIGNTNSSTSFIESASGPTAGTGTGASTAGDSFRTPTAITGNFVAGNWTLAFGMRTGAASHQGRMRCNVWASANTDGSAARKLNTTTLVGSTAAFAATNTTYTTSITWAAPAITLANEYLFFQLEWNSVVVGTSNSCTALFYQSAGSITTTDFALPPATVYGVQHFRWRKDTGAVDATPYWDAAEDTNIVSAAGGGASRRRLRFVVENTGATGTTKWSVYYSKDSGAYTKAISGDVYNVSDASTDADETAVTVQRLTAGSGSWQNGVYDESGETADFSLAGGSFTEVEFGLYHGITLNSTYDFRLYADTQAVPASVTPRVIGVPWHDIQSNIVRDEPTGVYTLTENNAASQQHYALQYVPVTAGSENEVYAEYKPIGPNPRGLAINIITDGGNSAQVDGLANGTEGAGYTTGTMTRTVHTVTDVGGGWYGVRLRFTNPVTYATSNLKLVLMSGTVTSFNGLDNGSGVQLRNFTFGLAPTTIVASNLAVTAPTLDTPALAESLPPAVLVAVAFVDTPPTVGTTTLQQKHVLPIATALAVPIPTIASAAFKQIHTLPIATAPVIPPPSLAAGTLTQVHIFGVAADLIVAAPSIGTPTLVPLAVTPFTAVNLTVAPYSIATGNLQQRHTLPTPNGIAVPIPTIASAALNQAHKLVAQATAAGLPTLNAGTLTQVHIFGGAGAAGVIEYGSQGAYISYSTRPVTSFAAPAGIANGDLLLAYLFVGQGSVPPATTPPAGWSNIPGSPTHVNYSGFYGDYYVFYKVASGETGGNYDFVHNGTVSSCGLVIRYAGVDTAAAIATTTITGSGSPSTATGFTTANPNTFVIFTEHDWGDNVADTVPPIGTTPFFTERVDDVVIYVADGTLASVGATGDKAHINNSAGANPWAAYLIGIKPVTAAGAGAIDLIVAAPSIGAATLTLPTVCTAVNLTVAPYSIVAGSLKQAHALTPIAVAVSPPTLGIATAAVAAIALTANNLAVTAPILGTPALQPISLLTAANLATAPPISPVTTLGQKHTLVASALTSSAPVLTTAVLVQRHALAAANLTANSPVIPVCIWGQNHALNTTPLTAGVPVLAIAVLSQAGVMAAIPVAAGIPVLGQPAFGQKHLIAANFPAINPPVLSAASFSQSHLIAANFPAIIAPSLGSPALGQKHVFTAVPLAPVPVIGIGIMGAAGELTAIPTAAGVPILGVPAFGQRHLTVAQSLAAGAPALGVPALGKVLSAAALAVSAPVLGASSLTKVLAATSLGTNAPVLAAPALVAYVSLAPSDYAVPAPTIGTSNLGQGHKLNSVPIAIGSPVLPALTLGLTGVMSAVPLAAGAPVSETPALKQRHMLAAAGVSAGAPTFEAGALGGRHSLICIGLAAGAPALAPATLGQRHGLGTVSAQGGRPVLPQLTLGVAGELAATPAEAGAPVIGAAVLGQRHSLAAAKLETGAPANEAGNLSVKFNLLAAALAAGAPALGQTVLGQVHRLAGVLTVAGKPLLGAGFIGQSGVMAAVPLWVQPPILSAGVLRQRHGFTGNRAVAGAPELGVAEYRGRVRLPEPWDCFAGRFRPLPAVLGQAHRLTAQAVTVGAPRIPVAHFFEGETFGAIPLEGLGPYLGTPALGVVSRFMAIGLAPRPVLGGPDLDQEHRLEARDLTSGRPALGRPRVAGLRDLDPVDLETSTPAIGAPALGVQDRLFSIGHITSRPRRPLVTGQPSTGRIELSTGQRRGGIIGQRDREVGIIGRRAKR